MIKSTTFEPELAIMAWNIGILHLSASNGGSVLEWGRSSSNHSKGLRDAERRQANKMVVAWKICGLFDTRLDMPSLSFTKLCAARPSGANHERRSRHSPVEYFMCLQGRTTYSV
jgi:hypothetical protein